MAVKSVLAFAAAVGLFVGSALVYHHRRSTGSALLLLATLCFIVAALTHVFEALGILSGFGWGRPDTLGHYIDLTAAMLGLTLLAIGLGLSVVRRSL
jgi:hypothetical protein